METIRGQLVHLILVLACVNVVIPEETRHFGHDCAHSGVEWR